MRLALLALALGAATLPAAETPFPDLLGSGYLAPFVVLLLCGFGLPIPEELTMLGAGFLAHRGDVQFVPVILVCFTATLLGDSIPFFVGRHWGRKALRSRAVRRAVHPERLRAIERRFERHGLWAVFACRFIPGVRLPAWFTAGTLGIPYPKFLLVDALGAAIFTPTFVALGRFSGERISDLAGRVEGVTQLLGYAALAVVAGIALHFALSKKPRRGLGGKRGGAAPPRDVGRPPGAPSGDGL